MKLKTFLYKIFCRRKIVNEGKNNKIFVHDKVFQRKLNIKIYGDNNEVFIDEWAYMHNVHLTIGFTDCPISNCKIHIGKRVACNFLKLQLGESNSEAVIGDDTIISFGTEMNCSDTHCIFDTNTNELINVGQKIDIGSHVWICKNVTIMKNIKLPDNSIVAMGSVVTKKFDTKNVIIAGNPAKIVKENIRWDLMRPQQYLDSIKG